MFLLGTYFPPSSIGTKEESELETVTISSNIGMPISPIFMLFCLSVCGGKSFRPQSAKPIDLELFLPHMFRLCDRPWSELSGGH